MQSPTIASVTSNLFSRLDSEVLVDLRQEDPATAVEVHFGPVRLKALPAREITSGDCATDGYYETELDPSCPWIIYADDVPPSRRRFTVLHELGHHLLATQAAELLDDLDRVGGSAAEATRAEESVCHRLAGHVLVPEDLVREVLGSHRPLPQHLIDIKHQCGASWPATAIQVTQLLDEPAAVVLLERNGIVRFSCASNRLGFDWWGSGSATDHNGPLRTALTRTHRAVKETYRFGQAYARQMYCDSMPVHGGLAVAVLTDKPSDGRFDILDEPEPVWKERLLYCEHCNGDRDRDWCHNCHGPYCRDCGRCACQQVIKNPTCQRCGFQKPHRPSAGVCRDCEVDET